MRNLLVCIRCKRAIFLNSLANTAPKWRGKIDELLDDSLDGYEEIGGQDNLRDFNLNHQGETHDVIKVELV